MRQSLKFKKIRGLNLSKSGNHLKWWLGKGLLSSGGWYVEITIGEFVVSGSLVIPLRFSFLQQYNALFCTSV